MGFFGKLFGDALGQVVSDTVGKVVKEAIATGQNSSNGNQDNLAGDQATQQSGMAGILSRLQEAVNEVEGLGNTKGVAACLARWKSILPQYPMWTLPAKSMSIERLGDGKGGHFYSLEVEVEYEYDMENFRYRYTDILRNAGFNKAGKFPDEDHYYKRILGVVYHVDLEHWHQDDTVINILYRIGEPEGGYDYNPTGKPTLGDVLNTISGNHSGTQSGKGLFDIL